MNHLCLTELHLCATSNINVTIIIMAIVCNKQVYPRTAHVMKFDKVFFTISLHIVFASHDLNVGNLEATKCVILNVKATLPTLLLYNRYKFY